MKKSLLLAALLAHAIAALALPQHAPYPGGIAVIDLGPAGPTPPTARWGEQPLAVVREAGRWFALLGIPLDTLPGELEIGVFFGSTAATRTVPIAVRNYPEQRLTIKNQRQVEPNADDLARITAERDASWERMRKNWVK